MEGITRAVGEKGYANVTLNDIVRYAGMSKRTFYEHFTDKLSCFLAAYSAAADMMLARVNESVADVAPPDRVRAGTRAYLSAMAENPVATRTFHLEILAAGPEGVRLHYEVNQRFAKLLMRLVREARRERPEIPSLGSAKATALVGAINELVVAAVVENRTRQLPARSELITGLVRAALSTPIN
jgi:AcrR family transcriptional regulator